MGNFCRAISRNARLIYPTKLPRRLFAIEAVTGRQETFQTAAQETHRYTLRKNRQVLHREDQPRRDYLQTR
jgi:hypothetical protein